MIIENTKAINDFDITAGNQYFKIFAVQISNNHIIIIQKEAGVILAGKGKIPYSTYDWECNFEIINKFEDDIQSAAMDVKGDVYVVFKSLRDIWKFSDDGENIGYIDGSDDPTKNVRLFNIYVSSGAGWVYVVGTEYWDYDQKASSFIDKYNARTWERLDRIIISSNQHVSEEDPLYKYDNIFV